MSESIDARLKRLHSEGRKALVVYITAGHPTVQKSIDLMAGVVDAGADILEVGVPFSDPLADGPVIQRSSQIALGHGVTYKSVLGMLHDHPSSAPVVLFSYLNPVMSAGPNALQLARDAGAAGILVTDLPVGSDPEREDWFGAGPLDFVRLVAPTTPVERMKEIARNGRGFVYLISRLGVTGMQEKLATDLPGSVSRLRQATDLPICVGFGISTARQAAEVSRMADGVVVGSAVVSAAEESGIDAAIRLVADMRSAIDT